MCSCPRFKMPCLKCRNLLSSWNCEAARANDSSVGVLLWYEEWTTYAASRSPAAGAPAFFRLILARTRERYQKALRRDAVFEAKSCYLANRRVRTLLAEGAFPDWKKKGSANPTNNQALR